jgi:hypothetical protein
MVPLEDLGQGARNRQFTTVLPPSSASHDESSLPTLLHGTLSGLLWFWARQRRVVDEFVDSRPGLTDSRLELPRIATVQKQTVNPGVRHMAEGKVQLEIQYCVS